MSNGESAPRRQGQRRRHQRWNGPERDGRAPFFHHYDGLKSSRMSYQAPHSEARRHNHAPVPDELSLELMSQDCSLVKNQLLRLKNLLQLEDTTDSTANVAGEIEGNSNGVAQFEELLKEVHALREELRSRDKTIVQLTLQCQQLQQHQQEQALARERQVRCQCQRQRAPSLLRPPGDKRLQRPCDKATQTHWRTPGHALQIPFNFSERFRPGRPVKILPTEARSDQTKDTRARFDADAPLDDLTSYVADLLRPSQCPSSPAATWHDPVAAAAPSLRGEGASLPAVKPLRHSSSSETFAGKTRQLPPPTRGLPCFNSGPRQQVFSSCGTSSLLLRRISEPRGGANPENADREPLKETAKMIAPLGRSCLPKPKIP